MVLVSLMFPSPRESECIDEEHWAMIQGEEAVLGSVLTPERLV